MATYKIKDYEVGPSEEFFFDTNVWMLIFAPLAGSKQDRQRKYSSLFRDILLRGATIWINSQVVAEFINANLRLEFKQWKEQKQLPLADFKRDFRSTQEYTSALNYAKSLISDILEKCQRYPDDFNTIDINAIISSMGTSCDYGDAIIIDLCKRRNYKLVTDDSDMIKVQYTFHVITA